MSISSVSPNSNPLLSQMNDSNITKQLEKQKSQLQDQIKKVNDTKMDDMTKRDRVKVLQDQIEAIDTEIMTRQREKITQNQQESTSASSVNTAPSATTASAESPAVDISGLTQASVAYSQAKTMHATKTDMDGKGNVLKIEIKQDELRGGIAKHKRAELKDLESHSNQIDKEAAKAVKTAESKVSETAKKETRKASESADKTDNTPDAVRTTSITDTADAIQKTSETNTSTGTTLDLKV